MTKLKLVGNTYTQARPKQPTLKPIAAIAFVFSLPFFYIIYVTLGV